MIDIGHFCLISAWLLSLFGLIAGSIAAVRKNRRLAASASNSVWLVCLFTMMALFALGLAFYSHDYRYVYVWQNSNNAMPALYRISAIWGGMDGSMLLWAAIMSVFGALVVMRARNVQRELMMWVVPVLSGATNFFLVVVCFLTNPFRLVPVGANPLDGNGLNPLLQNPSMLIHPPCLYAGFTGFVVPFAFCLAALLSGCLGDQWIRHTRRWTLIAWGFLTVGIILGGHWAYIELGWGGFWAWDPVENASFMPWLIGTAFLHSVMVQQRRSMLKVWNVVLSILTYGLTIFGTFLTRSGVVQSVHAFAETDVGWVFLAYLGVITVFSIGLIIWRWSDLRPENKFESYLSRDAAFLFNNLALLGICFCTFWGVVFPLVSEALGGEKSVVGPPFFNQVNVPLFLVLIFLMGAGPLLAWRSTSRQAIRRVFVKPLLIGSIVTIGFLLLDPARIGAAVSFGLCTFVLITIGDEFHRGANVRKQLTGESIWRSAGRLLVRKPQKYGGFLVHLGVVVMTVSITASMVYKIEKDFTLLKGERVEVGRYSLELASLDEEQLANYHALRAKVNVFLVSDNSFLKTLYPERRFYAASDETTSEVDIRTTPRDDLYIALAGLETSKGADGQPIEKAVFKVFVNPLQMWLWVGSLIMLSGTFLVLTVRMREAVFTTSPALEHAKQGV